jgi:hypothetical protein
MGKISDCLHLKVTLKKKIFYLLTLLPKDFSYLLPELMTLVMHLELQISPRVFKQIQNSPNGILRGLGETD